MAAENPKNDTLTLFSQKMFRVRVRARTREETRKEIKK